MSIGDEIGAMSASPAKLNMGHVIDNTFAVVGRNLIPFLFLSVMAALPQLLLELALLRLPPVATLFSLGGFSAVAVNYFFTLAKTAVFNSIGFLAWAGIAHGTFADLNNKRASLGECLATGLSSPLLLVGLAIASGFAIQLAMLLMVFPGVMLAMSWSLLVPVRVVEHTPFGETFSRSSDLTRDNRGVIFGLYLVLALVGGVLAIVALQLSGFGITRLVQAAHSPTYLIATSAIGMVTTMITGTGVATIYYELRRVTEGIGPEQLAAVFD